MSRDLRREAGRILTSHPYAGGRAADLALVLQRCSEARLSDGDVVCVEGDKGEDLYFLVHGTVRVLKRGPTGEDKELAQVAAPALLGHMSVIDHSARSATCVAAGPCQVMSLDRKTYSLLLTESSARGTALRRLLLSSLTRQLVSGNARLQALLRDPRVDEAEEGSLAKPRRQAASGRPRGRSSGDVEGVDLLRTAGVLEGWQVDMAGIDDVQTYEDEDMKRSRTDPKRR